MESKEKDYLNSLINEVKEIEKFVEGISVLGRNDSDETTRELIYFNDIDSWLNNVNYLTEQISDSAKIVLRILEVDKDKKHSFWGTENREAYYYNENIMFRLTILWDLLAQISNVVFKLNENVDDIHYKRFFDKYSNESKCTEPVYQVAKQVKDYLDEIEGEITENPWTGNHDYVNELRNSFTHRLNPHIVNFNNGIFRRPQNEKSGTTLPTHPLFELKRILEDYVQVYRFIFIIRNKYVKEFEGTSSNGK
jgi:hypothetical protein